MNAAAQRELARENLDVLELHSALMQCAETCERHAEMIKQRLEKLEYSLGQSQGAFPSAHSVSKSPIRVYRFLSGVGWLWGQGVLPFRLVLRKIVDSTRSSPRC